MTSIDVAQRAGVSQSTVSLVLSGKGEGRVAAATADAVRTAATELGYHPNAAARTLKSGLSHTVGLVVPDITNPVFGLVLRGAQQAATAAGYTVILVDVARGDGEESVRALRAAFVDGLLVFAIAPPAAALGPGGPPVVLMDMPATDLPSVTLDLKGGVHAAMEHLLGLGHRRIAHLRADVPTPTFVARANAWARALLDAGIDPADDLIVGSLFSHTAARVAGRDLLQRSPRPTAVLCDDDVLAAGLLLAARDLGLTVPGDVSVVGFDDMPLAEMVTPPLTTVAFDVPLFGTRAFEVLLAHIRGDADAPRSTWLATRLVIRESTAPPPTS
ncbi:LacI family DNA-binding transcriptional regulator [Paraconexibacter sp. AEG42_29]|uniref:LacI family DNA-binding transcriptional regulator n=1 Tax=Paraconexibacter sp. AEG42_29 TaxID=2997339 RepID=UPI00339D4879